VTTAAREFTRVGACGDPRCDCAVSARSGRGHTHCPSCRPSRDTRPTLLVSIAESGFVAVRCSKACTREAILAAFEAKLPAGSRNGSSPEPQPGKASLVAAPAPAGPAPAKSAPVASAAVSEPTGHTQLPDLAECVATFRRYLHMPDPGHLYIVLAAAIANLAPGDPVWLLLVGPPSAGKTEVVSPLVRMPWAHSAATLTEAALLSGTPKREVHASAKGGLLREVGDFGVLVMKDFTSILAQNRDTQAQVLAALREVFDGSWTRHVGTDGGRTLHWEGKLGLIAGCTPTIDQHHAVIGSMGNRFVFHRLATDDVDADKVAEGALAHSGHESAMRADLANAVQAVLVVASEAKPRDLSLGERVRLGDLAVFATACRTAVERDPHTREVLAVPEREGPARFVGQLRLLLHGLEAVGVGPTDTWQLLAKLAMDAMPAGRFAVLRHLRGAGPSLGTGDVASAVGLPTVTARRCLEDLTLLEAVDRSKAGSQYNASDLWAISQWAVRRWPIETVPDNPDKEIERGVDFSLSETRTHTDVLSGTARTAPDRTTHPDAISAESAQSTAGAALPLIGPADPPPSVEAAFSADQPVESGEGAGPHAAPGGWDGHSGRDAGPGAMVWPASMTAHGSDA
jgi:hypothetical protein